MGLFDDTDRDGSERDEVVIEAPDDEGSGSKETRLGKEVETDLVGETSSDSSASNSGSDITMEDIHRQNETIIDLLEKLVDDNESKNRSRSSSRVTDRGSASSNRVTDRGNEDSEDETIGDGMNELL